MTATGRYGGNRVSNILRPRCSRLAPMGAPSGSGRLPIGRSLPGCPTTAGVFRLPTCSIIGSMARVTELLVNGGWRRIDVDSNRTLLSVLRDDLDLTGAKFGCGEGQCAACTVLVDGVATKSRLIEVGAVQGKRIVT